MHCDMRPSYPYKKAKNEIRRLMLRRSRRFGKYSKMNQEALSILQKETVVLFADECHLKWGDTLGYVLWGLCYERIEVPIINNQKRQTYYGIVNLLTGQAFVMPAETGNSDFCVCFLKALRRHFQGQRLFIVWDRASYHRGHLVTDYLKQLNSESPELERLIPKSFAPHAPKQNPMEDSWLAAKRWIRNFFSGLMALNRSGISL